MKTAQECALVRSRFDGLAHSAVHPANVAVIVTHQQRGRIAQRFLRLEAKHVLVEPGNLMQADSHCRQEVKRGGDVYPAFAWLKHLEPARGLEVAQAARSILDIWLQMINRILVFRPAANRKPRQLMGKRGGGLRCKGSETSFQ